MKNRKVKRFDSAGRYTNSDCSDEGNCLVGSSVDRADFNRKNKVFALLITIAISAVAMLSIGSVSAETIFMSPDYINPFGRFETALEIDGYTYGSGSNWNLVRYNSDGSDFAVLAEGTIDFITDGSIIYYSPDDEEKLYSMNMDGSNKQLVVSENVGAVITCVKDKYIYYTDNAGYNDASINLWRYNLNTGEEELVLKGTITSNVVAANGKLYYGLCDDRHSNQIVGDLYVSDLDGKNSVLLIKDVSDFKIIDSEIYYAKYHSCEYSNHFNFHMEKCGLNGENPVIISRFIHGGHCQVIYKDHVSVAIYETSELEDVYYSQSIPFDALLSYENLYGEMYRIVDCLCILPFWGYGTTYREDKSICDWSSIIYASFKDFTLSPNDSTVSKFLNKAEAALNASKSRLMVFDSDVLAEAVECKLGVTLDSIADSDFDGPWIYCSDGLAAVVAPARGTTYPDYDCIVYSIEYISPDTAYCKYNFSSYGEGRSGGDFDSTETIHVIFERKNLFGQDIIAWKYLSMEEPPSSLLAPYGVSVEINGSSVSFDQPPIIVDGRTLVPMRAIFEALGYEVIWDDGMIDVYDENDNNVMTLWIDNNTMWTPDSDVTLDVAPTIINNRTLVPVRAISESIGANVYWNNDTRTVEITTGTNMVQYDEKKYLPTL